MAYKPHTCDMNVCSGEKYCHVEIKCNKCKQKVFLECFENFSEFQYLLEMLEITAYDGATDKKKYVDKCNLKLKKVFNGHTILFICTNCDMNSISSEHSSNDSQIQDSMNEIAELKSIIDSNKTNIQSSISSIETILATQKSKLDDFKNEFDKAIGNAGESLNSLKDFDTKLAPFNNPNVTSRKKNKNRDMSDDMSETNNNNNVIANKPNQTKSNSGVFEIYIAEFETKITCENIAQHITNKTKLSDQLFHVQMLGGKRKFHNYASFKVTTLDKLVCDSILKMNWNPQSAQIMTPSSKYKIGQNSNTNGNQNTNSRQKNNSSAKQSGFRSPQQQQYQLPQQQNVGNPWNFNPNQNNFGNNFVHGQCNNNWPNNRSNFHGQRRNFNNFSSSNGNSNQQNNNGNFFGARFRSHRPRMNYQNGFQNNYNSGQYVNSNNYNNYPQYNNNNQNYNGNYQSKFQNENNGYYQNSG